MKITKALLKQIIQEEVQKVISEQTSFTQAGDAAAAKRAREMEGPGAIEKFLAKDVDAADADAVMDFSDEPMDIVADVPSIDLGTQTIKPRKKKSKASATVLKNQRAINKVLKIMKSKGLPAKRYNIPEDGLKGPKTSQAAADIRKQAKRGETLLGVMSRVAGVDLSDPSVFADFISREMKIPSDAEVRGKVKKLDL